MHRELALLAAALAASAALAQLLPTDPDWREAEVPPPPALRTSGLISLEMPASSLRFGVDPASIAVGDDGIVRYVVVAMSNTGAVNAMYEGIRCNSAEFKTYARHTGKGWTATQAEWRPLHDGSLPSKHSLLIARTGACIGRAANRPAEQIARDLRAPADIRFSPERR